MCVAPGATLILTTCKLVFNSRNFEIRNGADKFSCQDLGETEAFVDFDEQN
jgi:hypothetical protein